MIPGAAPVVEVVRCGSRPPTPDCPTGGALDNPQERSFTSPVLVIEGWAVGPDGPPAKVDVLSEGFLLASLPMSRRRRDLEDLYPHIGVRPAGFQGVVSLLGLKRDFDVRLVAEFADGRRTEVAWFAGRLLGWRPTETAGSSPLLITTLGRTGSSWISWILGLHPEVMTYRPFEAEPRVASYWSQIVADLLDPAALQLPLDVAQPTGSAWWRGRIGVAQQNLDPSVSRWLAEEQPAFFAAFSRERVHDTWRAMAASEGRRSVRFVTEKCQPTAVPRLVRALFPETAEIILVRDFRDMACSILAFNAQRGFVAFDRDQVGSDGEYMKVLHGHGLALRDAWRERERTALLVRYEDVVLAPDLELKRILDHVGVHAPADAIAEMAHAAFSPGPGDGGHRTTTSARGSVGRWRVDLGQELADVATDAFGDLLEDFGYPLS